LGHFKYANFFLDATVRVLKQLSFQADFANLNIILPMGISFYTFQTLSYTVDVYRKQWVLANSLLDFALSVCSFHS
jgi:D-alanyl-lipoteichoic acid acyltransferase DltB (MBOAT superfamily)